MDEVLLLPKADGEFLPPREIVQRLIDAFAYVLVHRPAVEEEQEVFARQVALMEELGAPAERLESWKRDNAPGNTLQTVVYDDPGNKNRFLRLILTPDTGLHIGWESRTHCRQSAPLVTRLKDCLDYEYGET